MIGAAISRTDGPAKVTGRARYSYERQEPQAPLYGVIVGAGITRGRIRSIVTAAAEAAPGVRLVWTHHNAPRQARPQPKADLFDVRPQLHSDRVEHYGMPVAFVVADTFERATEAAALIAVEYEAEAADYSLAGIGRDQTWDDVSRIGDLEVAIAKGPVTVDATYTTPYHFAHPMEPHACIAEWRDGHLTVYLAAQMIGQLIEGLADTLLLDRARITVDSRFVGGGFGSKIGLHAEAVLASLAARALGRPVKLMLTRRQIFALVGHRPATHSRVRLAATRDGRLTALGHDTVAQTSSLDRWKEGAANVARPLYAAANRLTRNAYATVEVGLAEPVRGPGEMPGLMAFEAAMDELAEALDIDPVELRLRNDTFVDPEKHRPLSGRRLADCLREGAARFGWEERPKRPASRRDGRWLVGYGVASSIRGHYQGETEVTVRIDPEGVTVRSDMTDLGTGTYTIVAQVAAAALGVGVEQVDVRLASTDHPKSQGSGGSWGSGNVSVATDRACQALRERVRAAAGAQFNDILAEVRRHFPDGIEATGRTPASDDDPNYTRNSLFTYGATFAEVAVDADTAEIRLRRMLGVFAAGRILNPKTARSQLLGGMIWGVSAALFEGAYPDPRHGAWVNADFAQYCVPTHADIGELEAVILDDFDESANHLGIKGIGELGAGGTGASVANAVYNATGVRVRDFPITIDKLLPGLMTVR